MDEAGAKKFTAVDMVMAGLLLASEAAVKTVSDLSFAIPGLGQVIFFGSEFYTLIIAGIFIAWFVMKLGALGMVSLWTTVGGVLDLIGVPVGLAAAVITIMVLTNNPKLEKVAETVTTGGEGEALEGAAGAEKNLAQSAGKEAGGAAGVKTGAGAGERGASAEGAGGGAGTESDAGAGKDSGGGRATEDAEREREEEKALGSPETPEEEAEALTKEPLGAPDLEGEHDNMRAFPSPSTDTEEEDDEARAA